MEGYRKETKRWIKIVRKDQGEERVRNRRNARLQEGSERWIKIVRKDQGEERVRNIRNARDYRKEVESG